MITAANSPTPIVKHSKGKSTKRQLRQLRKGRGKLVEKTDRQIVEMRDASENTIEVPIVVYYELEQESFSLFSS